MYFAFQNWWIGDKTSFYSGTPARFSCHAFEDYELLRGDKTNFEEPAALPAGAPDLQRVSQIFAKYGMEVLVNVPA